MSDYAEMARERKRARPLYLELRSLELEVRTEEDPQTPLDYNVVVDGLFSLSEAHADRVIQRVLANQAGLVRVLMEKWNPDLEAVRREGTSM